MIKIDEQKLITKLEDLKKRLNGLKRHLNDYYEDCTDVVPVTEITSYFDSDDNNIIETTLTYLKMIANESKDL